MPHVYKQLDSGRSLLYAWFPVMHTRADLVLCHRSEKELIDIASRIEAAWKRLEKTGSFYDTESELYQVNRTASHERVHISNDLYDMIAACMHYHPETEGCFDITVRSDGYDRNTLAAVALSPEASTIHYHREGVRIDLSGFLKGYALEKAKEILSAYGISDALLNMGNSSVMALGDHPHGEGWKVSFAASVDNGLQLRNQCLTTSGNETAERKHIVSPQTGEQVTGAGSIAVVTENAAEGEVFSTALFAATPAQRKVLAGHPAIQEIHEIPIQLLK